MATQTYSIELAVYKGLAGVATAVPVPAGYKWVVRCMDFYCGPSTPTPTIFVRGQLGQAFFYATGSSVDGAYNSWRGRQVLGTGATLQVAVTAGTWDVSIMGYRLTLP